MRRTEGFLLVVTLLITAALAILVFGTLFTSMVDRTISSNQQGASSSRYVAQAGLQQVKTLIFRFLTDYFAEEGEGWCDSPIAGGFGYGTVWLDPEDPSKRVTDWITFGPGEYQVSLDLTDTFIVLTSVGRVGRSQSTVQLVATSGGGPATAWDNAIFAEGTSPNAKAITGNVAVYGSVHIVLGELEIEQNFSEDISVTGTAGIYNSYSGKAVANSDIRDALESLTGDRDVDLCSRVKVEKGDIYLDSNASRVGTEADPLYSVHIGQGRVFSGRKNANPSEIEDHNDSDRINLRYPVVGVNSGYAGFELKLPRLAADYPDDIDGAFNVQAAVDAAEPPGSCDWLVRDDSVTLPPLDASLNHECQSGQNILRWDGSMTPGRIVFERADGSDEPVIVNTEGLGVRVTGPVSYAGKGAIRSGGCEAPLDEESSTRCVPNPALSADMIIDGSFLPVSNTYPDGDVLGLVTTGDMYLGMSAQTTIAALAYSAGTVHVDKQTLVVGALVASKFDIGNQVPKVAWHREVPAAASYLGMPGAPAWEGGGGGGLTGANPGVFRNISLEWREAPAN